MIDTGPLLGYPYGMLQRCEGTAAMILAPHPTVLRQAVEALVRGSRRPIKSIAAEMGLAETTVRNWSRRGGWRRLPRGPGAGPRLGTEPVAEDTAMPLDGPALRAALRRHVARQIARFDAALDAETVPDSARVLRDLGGLKRLLDELAIHDHDDAGGRHGAEPGSHDADDLATGADLPALRAEIARRYAAFAGERPDGAVPGEPSGGAAESDRT